ncbi:retrotransposon ty3-gypsy subclass [Lichtheimia corymbifera JMRC:FSU:9682]|uniref:Retrotransposon ty3-gypsy subclass n=1 Tax=Lichtheimia corymbifera JMRC:FSU:9682 TaxID=1263082 RepID=A0A068SIU8_9FUNG|nr:retrotransposon ty3-gypsy subclass [Lichtheimia corymbifera JMRC:FSU:9682]
MLKPSAHVQEGNLIDLSDEPTNVKHTETMNHTSNKDRAYIDELCTIKEADLPLYSMGCNNHNVTVLIDSGATCSYVSPRVIDGLPTTAVTDRSVETAGGHTLPITQRVTLLLNAGGYHHSVEAYVLDTKFDLILGHNWLKQVAPVPEWDMDTWRINEGDKQYLLRPLHTRAIPDLAYLISHRQLQRYSRAKQVDEFYLAYVKPSDHDQSAQGSVQALLHEYQDVFQDQLPGLPPYREVAHIIDTGDAEPINRPPFKMSPLELEELRKQLKELLDLRLIRPSTSPWGAPVLFVRKKSGDLRMCIDYRAINQVTKRHGHPLPRIDECLEQLSGAKFFTSLDLKSGYHQLRIQDDDVPKTAFNTRYGSYEWLVVPFGLRNSPALFQSTMNRILNEYLDDFVMVYLDDILIYSKSKEEHELHVRKVLQRLRDEKLIANIKKCEFYKTELEFLGFHISAGGYLPSRAKVKAIQEWPTPTNVHEVRQFVGLGSHYRRFIRNFAAIASPLTDLTKGTGTKTRAIIWSDECQQAFDKIKSLITQAPILASPDDSKPYIIETDACDYGVGAVLLQKGSDGIAHPIAFESKKLSKEERSYPAQERELLAILHALRTWRCFIEGRSYTVFSDHNPLHYFRTQSKPTTRLTRWIADIELYDPDIQYKPGKENYIPDLLSRRDGPNCDTKEQPMEPEYLYAMKSVQDTDWPKFYASSPDNWPITLKDVLEKHKDKFVVKENQVYRLVRIGDNVEERRYVFFARRADLIHDFHLSVGHAGKTTMVDLMTKRWWWPQMRKDIQEWLAGCPECQLAANADRKTHHAPMVPLDVPPVFARWHLDFIGELPTTARGNRWLLVAVDYATNWVCARAVPIASGESIAKFIYEEIVLQFGCMNEILTDRGSNFMSNVLAHYLGRLKVKHKLTSAFHPRTNAKAERTNGIIKQMIRKYAHGDIYRWDEFIQQVVFSCRMRKHRTTGYSPYYLVYGKDPHLPGDELSPFILHSTDNTEASPEIIAKGRVPEVRELRKARLIAEQRLNDNAKLDKQRWDRLLKPQVFAIGDFVLLRHENRLSLEYNWKGPYRILARNLDTHIYQIQDMHNNTYSSWVHTDRLRPIHINSTPPDHPWYDPTVSRATIRSQLSSTPAS